MEPFPESDWKTFRRLQEKALERFCKRILDEVETIRADGSRSHHQRYLAVYRLLQKRDRELGDAFNDPRRSHMLRQLLAIIALRLVEQDELRKFSPQLLGAVQLFLGRD